MILPKITKIEPIHNAVTYFTDAKKDLKTGYSGPTEKTWQSKYSSVQKAELKTIYTVLLDIKKPVNIVPDSQYAVKVTSLIETVTVPNSNLPIIQLFNQLQNAILHKNSPFYITHIWPLSQLPRSLTEETNTITLNSFHFFLHHNFMNLCT